jgi:GT2 family glycosyltransferase
MVADAAAIRTPRVSVVVLSYNRPDLLRQALEALHVQTYPAARLEVLVVDNYSAASAEVARIVAGHPRARLLANAENLGFTGGMNAGLRAATGDLVYLTEDDIVLHPDNVAELVKYIEADPRAGVVSGIIEDRSSGKIWFAGGFVRLGGKFDLEMPERHEADLGQFTRPFRVTYLSGSSMLARRDLWTELGGFREDFFMYSEDVELGVRVLALGRDLVVVPSARSSHFTPEGGAEAPLITFHKWKNLLALYTVHASASVLPEFFLTHVLGTLQSRPSDRAPQLRAWRHFARHLPRLLRERRAKA